MTIVSNRLARVCIVTFLLVMAACGDDEDAAGSGADAGVDGGTERFDAGELPDGAVPGERGYPCAEDAECDDGLGCVANTLPSVGNQLFGFCGKRCTGNSQCEASEACVTTTGFEEDLHCAELAHEEYAVCGPLVATVCDGRACLFPPSSAVGYCVDLCTLDGDADAGVEDAGVAETLQCRGAGQDCIEGVLSDPSVGLCGEYVARGEACLGSEGRFCAEGDVCAPLDADDLESELRCHESCASGPCTEGSCVTVSGLAYCQ